MRMYFLSLLVWLSLGCAFADNQPELDIEVNVQTAGETVIVDVSLTIPAMRQQVWAVLTDFDHMSAFVSNLKESKVVSSSGDTLRIFQHGTAQFGPIRFPFKSTRELRLTPFEQIESHLISGNMRRMDGITKLTDENGQTRVTYHAESVPGLWLPPVVGKSFIEHETREQFQEIREEVLRRKQQAATGS